MSSTSSNSETSTVEINLLEWGVLLFFIFAVTYWGHRFAPDTKYWDDLLYIHTAWTMEALPTILNRYFTIYLLRILNSIVGTDPILIGKYFGAFTASAIVALVYLNARIVARVHYLFAGLLGTLFLITFVYFTGDFGVVLPDYTVTMMILVGVLLFLLYWRSKNRKEALLFLFGLVLILAFKSKETGIILGILIPSFFIDTGESLSKRDILMKLGLILAGCLLGILMFMLLDGIFLKDILFSFRPSNIKALLDFNTYEEAVQQDILINYLTYIASNSAFFLALVWTIRSDDHFKRSNRWLWFSVLGLVCFLNLTTVNAGWQITPRYLTPAIAILSILAPQVIELESPPPTRNRTINLAFMVAAFLFMPGALVGVIYIYLMRGIGWGFDYFTGGVLSQLILCFLLVWLCFKKRSSLVSLAVIVGCIGALIVPTAAYRVYRVLSNPQQPSARFQPFIQFKNDVACTSGNILISGTIYGEHKLLSRDVSSSQQMYNLFFRCRMTGAQFYYSNAKDEILDSLLQKDFQYIFLDATDYEYLVSQPEQSDKIFDRYSVKFDESQLYYLFTINP